MTNQLLKLFKFRNILAFTGLVLALSGLVFCTLLFSTTYPSFIDFLSRWMHKKPEQLQSVISESRFTFLRLAPLFLLLAGVLLFLFRRKISQAAANTRAVLRQERSYFQSISPQHKLIYRVILGCFAIAAICNALFLPVTYDEAWTYLNFTSKNPLVSATYYPAPNNHILHSILTNFTAYLPFGSLFNLRISSILIGILSAVVFFRFLLKKTDATTSLLVLCLYCFSYPVLYYSSVSRGYILTVLAFLICLYALDELQKTYRKTWNLVFIAGSLIGFYAMPSFLYPFLTLVSFYGFNAIRTKNFKDLFRMIRTTITTTVLVCCLYVPVFAVSGIRAVTSNDFVKPLERKIVFTGLFDHFNDTSRFLTYLPLVYLLVLLAILGAFYLALKQSKKLPAASLYMYLLILPPVLLLIHAVIPFPRTWTYLIVPILLFFSVTGSAFLSKCSKPAFFLLLLPACGFLFVKSELKEEVQAFQNKELCHYLDQNHYQRVICRHPLMDTYLRFYNRENPGFELVYLQPNEAISQALSSARDAKVIISGTSLPELSGKFSLKRFRKNNYWLYLRK